jgi:hypothetical protein
MTAERKAMTRVLRSVGLVFLLLAFATAVAVMVIIPMADWPGWLENACYLCVWGAVLLVAGYAFRQRIPT